MEDCLHMGGSGVILSVEKNTMGLLSLVGRWLGKSGPLGSDEVSHV